MLMRFLLHSAATVHSEVSQKTHLSAQDAITNAVSKVCMSVINNGAEIVLRVTIDSPEKA